MKKEVKTALILLAVVALFAMSRAPDEIKKEIAKWFGAAIGVILLLSMFVGAPWWLAIGAGGSVLAFTGAAKTAVDAIKAGGGDVLGPCPPGTKAIDYDNGTGWKRYCAKA